MLVHNLDNLDQEPSSSAVSLTATNEVAQVFRTGAASTRYILKSIELAFNSYIPPTETGSPSKLSASVWSVNASGRPDTKQFDLSPPYANYGNGFRRPGRKSSDYRNHGALRCPAQQGA